MKKISLLLTLLTVNLFGQLNYSGYIHPSEMISTSDGKEIALPFRLAELKLGFSKGDIDLKLTSAIEYRWATAKSDFDMRELYAVWYPAFGEVSVGKQILAWGTVDSNNPTDNLNAYNYYYMFLTGTDRKIASLSALCKFYEGDWIFEGVIIADHTANKLPFNEPDFPLGFPPPPNDIISVGDPQEYGVRVQTTLGESDISLSWFKGHDRSFSLAVPATYTAAYRKTSVLGADMVTFVNDFTFRGEAAYYFTKSKFNTVLPVDAEYGQYVLQVEYTTASDIALTAQLLGNEYYKLSGWAVNSESMMLEPLSKDNFQMGMGTPFGIITDQGFLASASGNMFDHRLELKCIMYRNLDDAGTMLGAEIDYSPMENWFFHVAVNQFLGDDTNPQNIFTRLEDFSHYRIGIEYNF